MTTRILVIFSLLFVVFACQETTFKSKGQKKMALLGGDGKEMTPDDDDDDSKGGGSNDLPDDPNIDVVDDGEIDPTINENEDQLGDDDDDGGKDDDDDDSGGVDVVDDGEDLIGTKLSITGKRLDGNDAPLLLVVTDEKGDDHSVTWPDKGKTVHIEGICKGNTANLRMRVTLRGQTYNTSNQQCFVGKTEGQSSVYMGFEHDCDSTDYNRIDDAIALFSCASSGLVIENLTMRNSIDLGEWID